MSSLEPAGFDELPVPGERVGARYLVERVLGSGATGVVYEASHELTGKPVAIKWLRPDLAASESNTARFLREARAATAIDHPNVVSVFDAGHERGTLFLVMERLVGEPLTAYLARGPHRVESLIATMMPALRGVAAAHERGIVHRDLKPDNVFLVEPRPGWPGGAKVLDFGISKLKQPADGRELTHAGVFLGSPLYMAPEQILTPGSVDARSDVYSIGVMLYEGLRGEVPFEAETLHELYRKLMSERPRSLREVRADVPQSLEALVLAALSRDREQRPPSVEALARALEPYAAGVRFDGGETRGDDTDARRSSVPMLDGGRTEIVPSPLAEPSRDTDRPPAPVFQPPVFQDRASLEAPDFQTQPAIALPEMRGDVPSHASPAGPPTDVHRTVTAAGLPAWIQRVPPALRGPGALVGIAAAIFVAGVLLGVLIG